MNSCFILDSVIVLNLIIIDLIAFKQLRRYESFNAEVSTLMHNIVIGVGLHERNNTMADIYANFLYSRHVYSI